MSSVKWWCLLPNFFHSLIKKKKIILNVNLQKYISNIMYMTISEEIIVADKDW